MNKENNKKENITLKALFGLDYKESLQSVMFAPSESKHLNDRMYIEDNDDHDI